VSVVGTVR
nr:RecName: Full=Uncharacterized protein IMPP2 [Nautilus macromphalus]